MITTGYIAAAEFRDLFRSAQAIVTFALLFCLCFLLTANAGEFKAFAAGGLVLANAPFAIAQTLIKIGVFLVFAAPAFIAVAVLKDIDCNFSPIVFSTPVSKTAYLNGRFAGAFAALVVAASGAPLGLLAGTFWPWADSSLLGPTQLVHYLTPFLGVMLPSLIAIAAVVFAVAVTTRRLIYVYLVLMGLLIPYLLGGEANLLPPILDPFMFEVFEAQTRYWTAAERNTQGVDFDGLVASNRLLWIGLALVVYTLAVWRFSFQKLAEGRGASKEKVLSSEAPAVSSGLLAVPLWSRWSFFHQLRCRMGFEVRAVVASVPFVILMTLAVVVLVLSLTSREVHYGVQSYPVTRLMVGSLSSLIFALMVVLAFFSADVIWRERDSGFYQVLDATPVPNSVFVISKLAALTAILVAILLLGVAIAVVVQLSSGYTRLQPWLYLERGVLFLVVPYVCLAVLTCFFQVLARGRYIGMLLFGLFIAAIVGSRDLFGVEHPLLSFGLPAVPAPLSDMNGTGRFSALGYWVRVYWGCTAGMLLMLTYLLWQRGVSQPLALRLRSLRALSRPHFIIPLVALLAGVLGSGGYIYYNTNVLNKYYTEADVEQFQVDYERRFRKFERLPMPRITAVDMAVDIYPYQRRVQSRGTHVLTNQTVADIASVHVVFPDGVSVSSVSLEGAVESPPESTVVPYYIFTLDPPMAPGEQRLLSFETLIAQGGFTHGQPDTTLVRNGSFIYDSQIAPTIGFNPELMIEEPRQRERLGLPPLPRRPLLEDASQYGNNPTRRDSGFIQFSSTVSTHRSQSVITSGNLKGSWVEGERRYFRYVMDGPMRNLYAFVSAEFEVLRDRWNEVAIEIYYHRGHEYNLPRMLDGIKDSLSYFTRAFSPYQYQHLRLVEFPGYRSFAQSLPNMIAYSEDIGFLDQIGAQDLDMPYYITAHEVAHQWWGHQLTAANTQGDGFLHESLAQYSALKVMEARYGSATIRRFLGYELDRYLSERASDPVGELPLYRVEKQPYIHYRKGAMVMYALADYLGDNVVNRALAQLLELRAFSDAPYALSSDFVAILKNHAGPQHHGLIEDLLEKITLYDLKLLNAQAIELPDQRYLVRLKVETAKYYADGQGEQSPVPFDLAVDIGLFAKDPRDPSYQDSDRISLQRQSLSGSGSTLELIVDRRPEFAGIDPYHKWIDRNAQDNVIGVVSSTAP